MAQTNNLKLWKFGLIFSTLAIFALYGVTQDSLQAQFDDGPPGGSPSASPPSTESPGPVSPPPTTPSVSPYTSPPPSTSPSPVDNSALVAPQMNVVGIKVSEQVAASLNIGAIGPGSAPTLLAMPSLALDLGRGCYFSGGVNVQVPTGGGSPVPIPQVGIQFDIPGPGYCSVYSAFSEHETFIGVSLSLRELGRKIHANK